MQNGKPYCIESEGYVLEFFCAPEGRVMHHALQPDLLRICAIIYYCLRTQVADSTHSGRMVFLYMP